MRLRFIALVPEFLAAGLLLVGCGHKEGDGHAREKAAGKGEDHGHEVESPSGASFKPGQGVILTDETRKILGVEIADVAEEKLPKQVRFNIQVFGETHRHSLKEEDHAGCDVHGAGFVPLEKAALVQARQPVRLLTAANETLEGVVLRVQETLTLGEPEVIVGITNAGGKVKGGEFLSATISVPRGETVTVVPRSALLRTAEGTFVYTINGNAYFRTAVKIGTDANGKVEIVEGLLAGDQVVTKPVETLWLIELRATKGGGHSH